MTHLILSWWLLSFLFGGCTAARSRGSAEAAAPTMVVLQPQGGGVHLYEERRAVRLSGIEAQVLALLGEIAARLGKPGLTADQGTQGAAFEICRGLLPSGPPPASLVEFALRNNGLVDPPPHFVVAAVPPGAERMLLDQLSSRFQTILQKGSFTRVGIGLTDPLRMPGQRRLVVALFQTNVHFQPLRRQLALGGLEIFEFTVHSGFKNITMVVTAPTGKISSHRCNRRGTRYQNSLRCETLGVYQVEVTGEGQYGPEVLANFPIYCAQPPPTTVKYYSPVPLPGNLSDLEQDVFRRTNQLRQENGLSVLASNAALAEVARAHSRDMKDHDFVGHQSPTTGDPSDRLDRAGIVYVAVRENVARGYSAEEIMVELMKSPAHRDNILSRDVSELGVGVVLDQRGPTPIILVTQNYIAPGTRFDPATTPSQVLLLIDKTREGLGLQRLKRDSDLQRLAQRHVAIVLEAGGVQAGADQDLEQALKKLGPRFQQVEGVMVRVAVIDALAQTSAIKHQRTTHVGVGVGQLKNQLVIFVLQGIKR